MVKTSISKPVDQDAPIVGVERAEVIVESIERVKVGDTKEDVKRLLGQPDEFADEGWFYCLDEHSGYVIRFDDVERVKAVHSWKS